MLRCWSQLSLLVDSLGWPALAAAAVAAVAAVVAVAVVAAVG